MDTENLVREDWNTYQLYRYTIDIIENLLEINNTTLHRKKVELASPPNLFITSDGLMMASVFIGYHHP